MQHSPQGLYPLRCALLCCAAPCCAASRCVVPCPPECAVSTTSSHSSVLSLSGHSTARTASSSTSAAVPGRLPRPVDVDWDWVECSGAEMQCSTAACTRPQANQQYGGERGGRAGQIIGRQVGRQAKPHPHLSAQPGTCAAASLGWQPPAAPPEGCRGGRKAGTQGRQGREAGRKCPGRRGGTQASSRGEREDRHAAPRVCNVGMLQHSNTGQGGAVTPRAAPCPRLTKQQTRQSGRELGKQPAWQAAD